ncbi:Neutral cholesterol ester hydrolase [Rhizina undulata]
MPSNEHPPPTLLYKILYALEVAILKSVLGLFNPLLQYLKPNRFPQPSLKKSYTLRTSLTHHIYLPRDHNSSSDKLPIYIDIHGGGFVVGSPWHDADYCRRLADQVPCVVISIDYLKAPWNPFPRALYDIRELIPEILKDETLPIDCERVVVGGFSAGGNLALAASQFEEIRRSEAFTVKGVVSWYPPVDYTLSAQEKLNSKPEGMRDADVLLRLKNVFDWAYVPAGTDRTDQRLSMAYSKQEGLPDNLLLIGAQNDMLCDEARRFAERIGTERYGEAVEVIDREEFSARVWRSKDGGAEVKWEMVKNVMHGFTHMIPEGEGEEEKRKRRAAEDAMARAAEWVRNLFYSSGGSGENETEREEREEQLRRRK